MKLTKNVMQLAILLVLLAALILPLVNPQPAAAIDWPEWWPFKKSEERHDWKIDGDTVYVDNNDIYMMATPHTLSASGWIDFTFYSKGYTGELDVVYGFDYANNLSINQVSIYKTINTDRKWYPETKISTEYFAHAGVSKWDQFPLGTTVYPERWYETRCWIDIPFSAGPVNGKYVIGVKPTGMSAEQAEASGQLWIIDPWYNASWDYRKQFTVNNAGAGLTDYQLKFDVNQGAGVDAGLSVYCGGNCQADFEDIRFTKADGNTLLSIWREEYTNGGDATFWVELDSVPNGNTNFYMYYGNAAASYPYLATDAAHGVATFIHFDDFERGVNGDEVGGDWTETLGTVEISTTKDIGDVAGYYGTRSAGFPNDGAEARLQRNLTASDNIAIDFTFYKEDGSDWYDYHGDGDHRMTVWYENTAAGGDIQYYDDVGWNDTGTNVTADQWEFVEYADFDWTADTYDIWHNGVKIQNDASTRTDGGGAYTDIFWFRAIELGGSDAVYADNFYVRNYRDGSEPTVSSWGSEENLTLPTVDTDVASGVGQFTATYNGNITSVGGDPDDCDERGFVWDTASHGDPGNVAPAASGYAWNWTEAGIFGTGVYSDNSAVLDCNTTYYYRACAHNTKGWDYGAEQNFTTTACPAMPIVDTLGCTGFDSTWAILNGEVTGFYGVETSVIERGFDYGLTAAYGSEITTVGAWTTGTFHEYLSGLSPATVYHYRAKALGSLGVWGYGEDRMFATKGSPVPYEFWNTGGDTDANPTYAANWTYQTFTTNTTDVAHSITSIRLSLRRFGNPGEVTASIRHATDCVPLTCNCTPTGADLAYGTLDGDLFNTAYTWWEFELSPEICYTANTTYAIVLRATEGDNTNYVEWEQDAGGGYAGGNAGDSYDSGITWTDVCPADNLFEVWGEPCLQVHDAKVFSDYIEDGDWLITCMYTNTYPPYYDNQDDVSSLFYLQLIDGSTVKAQTKVPEWGYKPGHIYLSPDMVESLEWGENYLVRLYGDFTGYPYMEYALQDEDWMGEDLNRFDTWVRSSAQLMEVYYGTDLTTYVGGKGLVLNEDGGAIFNNCISSCSAVRPGIFQITSSVPGYERGAWTQASQTGIQWQTILGPYLTTAFTTAGGTLNINGSIVGALIGFLFYAVVAGLAFPPGHAIAAISIPFGIMVVVWYTGLLPLVALGVLLALAAFWIIWQMWLKGG